MFKISGSCGYTMESAEVGSYTTIVLQGAVETIEAAEVGSCAMGRSGVVGEFDSDIEEGIPYVTGIVDLAVLFFFSPMCKRCPHLNP